MDYLTDVSGEFDKNDIQFGNNYFGEAGHFGSDLNMVTDEQLDQLQPKVISNADKSLMFQKIQLLVSVIVLIIIFYNVFGKEKRYDN